MAKAEVSLDLVRKTLEYDPATGRFKRKVSLGRARAGEIVGGVSKFDGYVRVSVGCRQYPAHRLAWFYVHGDWPACQLDHINGDRADNRLSNLRLCTISENRWNSKKPERNTSGFKGVSWDSQKKRWQATITVHKKQKHLGRFRSREDAHAAYCTAALKYHGDFARFE